MKDFVFSFHELFFYSRIELNFDFVLEFAEAGELEPFSFNSVYQLVLHLSTLSSVAFL